jgi:dTDP-glucose 4,6-dehydratase
MVYGSKISSPVSEKTDTFPIGPYGLSKLKAEKILQRHQNKFSLSILRPRLIIGPGRVGTIEKLAKLINSGLPVFVIGNGKNRYQFISVDDICSALNLLLVYGESGVFNIGSDDPPTVEELFENTFKRLGIRKRMLKVPSALALNLLELLDLLGYSPLAPEQFRLANLDYVLDTSMLKDKLGWKPKFRDDHLLAQALQPLLESKEL